MKKTLLLLIVYAGILKSQTVLFTENFEMGNSGNFTMNTSDLSSSNNTNTWIVNSHYTGGTVSFTCLGFPFSFTASSTNNQPSQIVGNPTSYYMHITSVAAINANIPCATFLASDGLCVLDEYNFTKMSSDISTVGYSSVSLNFWWLCGGGDNSFGEIYYSIDGGSSWIKVTSPITKYNNQITWKKDSITVAQFANQTTLRLGFRFVNETATSASDPSFSLDDISIIGNDPEMTILGNKTEIISGTTATSATDSTNLGSLCPGMTSVVTYTIKNTGLADLDISNPINIFGANASDFSIITAPDTLLAAGDSTNFSIKFTSSTSGVKTANVSISNNDGDENPYTFAIKGTALQNTTGDTTANACFSFVWYNNTYTASSTPTHMFTNAAGCDSTVILHLTINTIDTSVINNSYNLISNATSATYQWLDCNNSFSIISGATNKVYNPTSNGSYAVIVDNGNCADTSACKNITTVGISPLSLVDGQVLKLYPNPSNGVFTIEGLTINEPITVFNFLGEVVFTTQTKDNKLTLNFNTMANGIYYLKTVHNGNLKLVKE